MTTLNTPQPYADISDDATLTIQRRLPGPIERVWTYLTDSDLRKRWLAAGPLDQRAGSAFELIWRNDALTDPPGQRPEGFSEEHRMECRIIEIDPPRSLSFTWQGTGAVTFELEPDGNEVVLTVTHRRIAERSMQLMIGPGWHMHLDLLLAQLTNGQVEPFWDGWQRLKRDYEQRMPSSANATNYPHPKG